MGTFGKIIRMVRKNTASTSEGAQNEIPVQSRYGHEGKEKAGWVSPVYSQSQPVVIDTATVVQNRCIGILLDAPEVEFYRVLRTHILQRTRGSGSSGTVIMVTSAFAGEGKTL